jgi:hypothetical protein
MSEIINLASENVDTHVYQEAAEIIVKTLKQDFSFVIQVWSDKTPETKYPQILMLTSDETHQIPQQINNKNVAFIFKQYAPMTNMRDINTVQNLPRIFPLPLCQLRGFTDLGINIHDRAIDWCWMGQYDPYRRQDFKQAVDIASNLNGLKSAKLWYNGWNNGTNIGEYCTIMNNSKIALAPTGSASFETFRFFEAMMCGCAVIGVKQPNVDFYNEAPFIKIENWIRDIEKTILETLSNTELLSTLSICAKKWHQKYCSPEGLAKYMLDKLNV